jgi:acyl transferase domain-containing protein/NAD(P)H-dependent flavin oxidoreductase YrpB (nitropropane dioxygenase family)/NAD(P)-dependent dehydrogenase (short-subunit alcohol dehydrogenase family)
MNTQAFQVIALTPPGREPAIAIAASRAGALGVLDLEYERDPSAAQAAVGRMLQFSGAACGVKVDSLAPAFLEAFLSHLPEKVGTVIFANANAETVLAYLPRLRDRDCRVLLEVTDRAQAATLHGLEVDGLIAKGHEAGGWVGEETTFILLQQLVTQANLPVWAHGGIGLHSAAACYAAGAAGVILDSQFALARESQLPETVKQAISLMDGSETLCIGSEAGRRFRVYSRPGSRAIRELGETSLSVAQAEHRDLSTWHAAVTAQVGWKSLHETVWPLGQDAAFASSLASRYFTVGGIIDAIQEAVTGHFRVAQRLRPLDEGSPLARSHETRYPIVQGPMTRVSDRAQFCLDVAEGGGLPFLALALMRAPEVDALLEETRDLLGDRPWGVGILGFVPLDLRQEQLREILKYRPPWAIIAGGRPDQAQMLEDAGIATYLHVPSPGLLRLFLKDGARRFIFEGRECGGHVGPRSSFVLWNTMIDLLLEELPAEKGEEFHILFAGGIHDATSAAMVASMAAPLAERGVRIGVLMGTSYLFTEEAVASGAILPGFQEEALRCEQTVLLESGPGHATRCVPTDFVDLFEQERLKLLREGKSGEEIRRALDDMNIGRLRIASKGVNRHPQYGQEPDVPKYITVNADEQRREGMYMIGQVAALRDRVCTIAELHHEVTVAAMSRLAASPDVEPAVVATHELKPSDIAIIGISAILPKAPDLKTFWDNVQNGVYAIGEIPKERWDWELYYDEDKGARDKINSRWGGFLDDVPFDPLEFGMPPNSLASVDPMHLLALVAAKQVLKDGGYAERPFDRSRTSVILGASGGVGDLGAGYVLRSGLPLLFGEAAFEIAAQAGEALPEWTEDSFAGLLLNVAAGRIANRLDFGGLNYIVDAACASSLTAVHLAVKELESFNTDIAIAGGVDTVQNPFAFMCFSKTQALSPTGRPRTFDASGDGIAISEGVVMLMLKRRADAERDGDRIYAIIQGVGGASDGRALGMTAPRPEGQILALQRAYAKAGFSPTSVGLFEAHGTGTAVGDRTEALSLTRFLEERGTEKKGHAVGSVKSMIGHTKATAGVASMAKVALSLYHKVLPPTLGVTEPNPKARLDDGPLYVNSETRPWIHTHDHPRRAGVSAFGFGGTNFHAVLEEYAGDFLANTREASLKEWPAELLLWVAPSRQALRDTVAEVASALGKGAAPALPDLAYTLWKETSREGSSQEGHTRLAVVATSLTDLQQKLSSVVEALDNPGSDNINDPRGIYLNQSPLHPQGRVAFLFPGQGSQYPNMLRDLALQFPEIRETFERVDQVVAGQFDQPLSRYVFPPPAFSEQERDAQQYALTRTNVAQPALGAAGIALLKFMQALGVEPEMVAGHSYGEYVALHAAGVFDEETLAVLSEARGRSIIEAARSDLGTMAAVHAGADRVFSALEKMSDVWVANLNSPNQTIISGTQAGIERAVEQLHEKGLRSRSIPVACAFHSPLVAPARERLSQYLAEAEFHKPEIAVFSNATAAPYPQEPGAIARLLADHLVSPVNFYGEIEAMYEAGARLFVEVGPRAVLTALVDKVLDGRPHLAVALDNPGRSGLVHLQHALAQLAVNGVRVDLERLYRGRGVRKLDTRQLANEKPRPLPATTWLVNGSRARPLQADNSPRRPALESYFANRSADDTAPADVVEQRAARDEAPPPASHPDVSDPEAGKSEAGSSSSPVPQARDVPHAPPATPTHARAQHDLAARPPSGEADEVMAGFQRVMGRFVRTQKEVMLAYLQGTPTPEPTGPETMRLTGHTASGETSAPHAEQPATGEAVIPPTAPVVPTSDTADEEEPANTPVAPSSPPVQQNHAPEEKQTSASPDADAEQLTRDLLAIVGERTGYPHEMLDLDLDLEASLGIDSIKRVEILGRLRETRPAQWQAAGLDMETLAGLKTLREIVEQLSGPNGHAKERSNGAPEHDAAPAIPHEAAGDPGEESARSPVERFTLRLTEHPLAAERDALESGSVVVITEDEGEIATKVAELLEQQGYTAVRLCATDRQPQPSNNILPVDLTSPEDIASTIGRISEQYGSIAALLHLLPLRAQPSFDDVDVTSARATLQMETRSLFLLAQELREALESAAESSGATLLAVSGMGGAFGSEGPSRFSPLQGALTGFVKTLAKEWPTISTRIVDVDLQEDRTILAQRVTDELLTRDQETEVGWLDGRRVILAETPTPLGDELVPGLDLGPESVLLITGGARGITADVARELAEQYHPTLVLVGRSPLPPEEEQAETRRLTDPADLKAALIRQLQSDDRHQGSRITPMQVEKAYQHLLNEREIRENMKALEQSGARVHYHSVDVRDEGAFGALIDHIYERFGRLDGVIHGAGIIEDKLVRDKSVESFERVLSTKVESALILSRRLRQESLKFLVLFSSVAGRYGNRGQADYAAANEVLNKLAVHLDHIWPGRVVAINWGPWEKRGMVSPEVLRQFAERGVTLVPPAVGRRMLHEEIARGPKGQAEVVIGGKFDDAPPATRDPGVSRATPLFEGVHIQFQHDGLETTYRLDPDRDLILNDHRLDGNPVLPAAEAMELMAEAAQRLWPELEVVRLRDIRVQRGIVLKQGASDIRLVARNQPRNGNGAGSGLVEVEITDATASQRPYYRAVVELAARLPVAPRFQPAYASPLQPYTETVEQAYNNYLFHGPVLQCIDAIDGISKEGIMATVSPSIPREVLTWRPRGKWIMDPVVIDSGFQLAIVWARVLHGFTPLPSSFKAYHRYAPLDGPFMRCYLQSEVDPQHVLMQTDLFFVSPDGRLLARFEGAESTCSRALNRLAGRPVVNHQ